MIKHSPKILASKEKATTTTTICYDFLWCMFQPQREQSCKVLLEIEHWGVRFVSRFTCSWVPWTQTLWSPLLTVTRAIKHSVFGAWRREYCFECFACCQEFCFSSSFMFICRIPSATKRSMLWTGDETWTCDLMSYVSPWCDLHSWVGIKCQWFLSVAALTNWARESQTTVWNEAVLRVW